MRCHTFCDTGSYKNVVQKSRNTVVSNFSRFDFIRFISILGEACANFLLIINTFLIFVKTKITFKTIHLIISIDLERLNI